MSHAEIWDDSSLVDSWNEALEEYKHYHSIHARGEKVEEVLKSENIIQEDVMSLQNSNSVKAAQPDFNAEGHEEGEIGEEVMDMSTDTLQKPISQNKLFPTDQNPASKPGHGNSAGGGPPIPVPHHLVGSVQDEGLKSLLMSWYYAGYYTGLYEGQHQTKPDADKTQD